MAYRTITGIQARRMSTIGLTAGIVLSVSAVSLWALQIPGMSQLPEKPAPEAPLAAPDTQAQKAAPKVDSETVIAMGDRLDLAVVHAPKEEPKPDPVITHPEPEGPEWAYLGAIHEASRTLAMVSVDGHQKILCEGRSFGDTKLVSVADDSISVEIKGTPKTIHLAPRDSSKSVAWVRTIQNGTPPPGVGQPGAVGQPGGPRGNLPPEVQARLQQRGLNPEQIQNFRQGRGGNGNGNGNNGGRGGRGNFNGQNGNFNGGGADGRQRAVPMGDTITIDTDSTRRVN